LNGKGHQSRVQNAKKKGANCPHPSADTKIWNERGNTSVEADATKTSAEETWGGAKNCLHSLKEKLHSVRLFHGMKEKKISR